MCNVFSAEEVIVMHEVEVASVDFSAHAESGQWGLRAYQVDFFARPNVARANSRSSVADLSTHKQQSTDAAVATGVLPPAPGPTVFSPRGARQSVQVDTEPVEFMDATQYLQVKNFAVEESPVHVPFHDDGSRNGSYNTSVVDIFGQGWCSQLLC